MSMKYQSHSMRDAEEMQGRLLRWVYLHAHSLKAGEWP
jgi:hypothetical protein